MCLLLSTGLTYFAARKCLSKKGKREEAGRKGDKQTREPRWALRSMAPKGNHSPPLPPGPRGTVPSIVKGHLAGWVNLEGSWGCPVQGDSRAAISPGALLPSWAQRSPQVSGAQGTLLTSALEALLWLPHLWRKGTLIPAAQSMTDSVPSLTLPIGPCPVLGFHPPGMTRAYIWLPCDKSTGSLHKR